MFVVVSQKKSLGSKILGVPVRTRLWKIVEESTDVAEVKNIGTRRDAERVCGLLTELAALRTSPVEVHTPPVAVSEVSHA